MIRIVLTFFLTLSVAGCLNGAGGPLGSSPSVQPGFILPTIASVTSEQVPDELEAVATAVALRLTGRSTGQVQRAVGVSNSGVIRPSRSVPLGGFGVRQIQFLDARADPAALDDREVAFNLLMQDGYGRETAVRAVIGYTKARRGVRITRSNWTPVSLPAPHFATFIVPADQSARLLRAASTWTGLYDAAIKAAIPRAQLDQRMADGGEFLIVSLSRRPMGNGARLNLELAGAPDGPAADASAKVRRLGTVEIHREFNTAPAA